MEIIDVNKMREACDDCERNIVIKHCWNCIYRALKEKLETEKRAYFNYEKEQWTKTSEMI